MIDGAIPHDQNAYNSTHTHAFLVRVRGFSPGTLLPRYANSQRHLVDHDRLGIGIGARCSERQRHSQSLGLNVAAHADHR